MPQITIQKQLVSETETRKSYRALLLMFGTLIGILLLAQAVFASGVDDEKRLTFTVPSAPWSLTLPAKDFEIAENQVKPDGSAGYFFLTSEESHLNVSFYIEPVSRCKDSKACRDMVWKGGNPTWEKPKNFVSAEFGNISYFEFLIPKFRGQAVQQQNMYAEFVVDGYWVDLHISKVLYTPADHQLFEQLVKAVKFEAKPEKTANSTTSDKHRQRIRHA